MPFDAYGFYAASNPYGISAVDYYDSHPRLLLSGPDPYGQVADQYQPSYGGYDDYGPPPTWLDILSQAIREGGQTARVAEAGDYPPGSTNIVYAPGYPSQPTPPPYPTPPGYQPPIVTRPQSQSGFSLTGSSGLWILAGLALLVFAGRGGRR